MKIQFRSPDQILFERENITDFSATLLDGRKITILQNHAPLLAVLQAGEARIGTLHGEEKISMQQCILKVRENEIILYTQSEMERMEV